MRLCSEFLRVPFFLDLKFLFHPFSPTSSPSSSPFFTLFAHLELALALKHFARGETPTAPSGRGSKPGEWRRLHHPIRGAGAVASGRPGLAMPGMGIKHLGWTSAEDSMLI